MAIQNDRIRERMKELGLSLSEVSALSGIPKSTIHRYASGERENIPISMIEALAPALQTSAMYLMGWDHLVKEKPAPKVRCELDQRLIDLLCGLTPEEFSRVVDFVSGLRAAKQVAAAPAMSKLAIEREDHPE